MPLTVPELSLVVLVGPSGAGKSTFAARHFRPTEVLSSDHYRGVVSDDPTDQGASKDAFEVLEAIVRKRLARGLLTVVDATNVDPGFRKVWVQLAKEFHVLPVAVVLDVDAGTAIARNAARPDRQFGPHVVRRQVSELRRGLGGLRREGFRYVHHLHGEEAIEAAEIHRPRPWNDRRDDPGPFDIIGDVHGCFDELCELLRDLGYTVGRPGEAFVVTPPAGRRALFLGDLVDRGPASNLVLRLVMDMVDAGVALCVPGNHEAKLLRWLQGKSVKPTHGIASTMEQLGTESEAFRQRCATFIDGLVSHFVLDGGALVVAHAGMRADLQGRASGKVREFALYGETTGETDEFGLPVRYPWARDYEGRAVVVYGHTPVPSAEWVNRTICIDTGCVFGGELTALRWPERELVAVPAARVYFEPARPLFATPAIPEPGPLDGIPNADDVLGGRTVDTRFDRVITVRPEQAGAALEALARFAEDPRWLVHLPPTMSPVETSARPDLLEHPDEAFAHYRAAGVSSVVCQEKHMGSRAVVVLCRDEGVAVRRFGFRPGEAPRAGIVLTRRGRRFFDDDALEGALLDRLRSALERAGTWARLATDWVVLDAELLPWSAKARALLEGQYAPVGTAGRTALSASIAALRAASARQEGLGELLRRTEERLAAVEAYTAAWRRYTAPTEGLAGHRLAPFHLLASEGAVHDARPHAWHLEELDAIARGDEELLLRTDRRFVDLADDAAVADAVRWWEDLTARGGEGMVVKPAEGFVVRRGRRLVQPALKVRGREYLRIVYGPEYTLPEHLVRLRRRGVGRKRALAERELVLGLEALHRFVERRPVRAVHAAVFAILALESEPIDPRL